MSTKREICLSALLIAIILAGGAIYQHGYHSAEAALSQAQSRDLNLERISERKRAEPGWIKIPAYSWTNQVLKWDRGLFLAIHGLSRSRLDYVFGWPVNLSHKSSLIILIFFGLLIWDRKNWKRHFPLMLLVIFCHEFLSYAVKYSFGRPRPYHYYLDEIKSGITSLHVLFHVPITPSFPSGHSGTLFAVAGALHSLYGRKMVFLYAVAAYFAFMRVYCGVHYPLDILAGAALGLAVGKAIVWTMRKWSGIPS